MERFRCYYSHGAGSLKHLTLKVLWALVVLGLAESGVLAQPAQVLIIRHAERPFQEGAVNLSLKGQERAMALVPFLTQTPELTYRGLPVALFATKIIPGDLSHFTLETIDPLSQRLRVLTNASYAKWDYANLAQEILTNLKYEKRTVLICWVREYIPRLAAALGIFPEPPPWPENAFDRVWVITYKKGQASLVNLPQRLLFGDSAE
ncbi:MAG: histidine phosphatase family protein [Thermodesulfobacteriota bacterium]